MADDPLSSERFSPAPSVTNFERHVATFRDTDDITVTAADEDAKQIALVVDPDDDETQAQAEQMGRDRFYDVTAGYREDVEKYCVVLEGE